MKVCIIGKGLISLTLAKTLVNLGICVDIYTNQNLEIFDKSRTLGISKSNIKFFNENILNIKKLLWKIYKIEIYSENFKDNDVLNFSNNKQELFSIIKNYKLQNTLAKELKKNKLFREKKMIDSHRLLKKNYNLFINCDLNSSIAKKFFYKKINKKYNSYAHSLIIKHKKKSNNNVAVQIFTEKGPLAFLPISDKETSVVFSVKGPQNINLKDLIKKYNTKYSINQICENSSFELSSSNLRSYYNNNLMAFGDMLHKIHPLAGQGFNMSIRDIKILLDLIRIKIKLGLELDKSICTEFEKKTRHKNYLFSNGIDFIYEFFNLESKTKNSILSKSVRLLGKNKFTNNLFMKLADKGILF
tara:strand:- start:1357 stop:2430 length:1074 start_codon:yes stop_codon:yes gene_type:complete